MASVILGDWTHRRGDAGGARAVPAEIDRPRPAVAWSWRPEHGGRVDQVRVAGTTVIVATMMPRDPKAPRWEHAVVYALDAHTGIEIARRVLPDPVRSRPWWWTTASSTSSRREGASRSSGTRSRRPISCPAIAASSRWPTGSSTTTCSTRGPRPTAGSGSSSTRRSRASRRACEASRSPIRAASPVASRVSEGRQLAEGPPIANDACAGGHELFVPRDGRWSSETDSTPPGISRLDRATGTGAAEAAWVSAHRGRPALAHPRARRRRRRVRGGGRRGPREARPRARGGLRGRPDLRRRSLARARRSARHQAAARATRRGWPGDRTARCSSRASAPTAPLHAAHLRASRRPPRLDRARARAAATSSTRPSATWCSPTARTRTAASRWAASPSTSRGACSGDAPCRAGRSTSATSAAPPTVYAGAGAVVVRGARSVQPPCADASASARRSIRCSRA